MEHAADLMRSPAPTVSPDTTVRELGAWLLKRHLDGACVVDDGQFVGVVTTMDLIFREKKVYTPSYVAFMDVVIPLPGLRRTREELRKISGATVAQILSDEPATVAPDTGVDEIATLMVERHYSVLPVLDRGELVGMITKADLLRATLELVSADE